MPGSDGLVTRLDALPLNSFSHILEVLGEFGYDIREYLDPIGLDADLATSQHPDLPSDTYYLFLESVLNQVNIPSLGLRVGLKFSLADYGVLGYACISSPTVKHLLEKFLRFQQIVGSSSSFSEALRVEGDVAMIEIQSSRADVKLSRFDIEEAVGQWCAAAEDFWSGKDTMYTRINLTFSKPSYAKDLQSLINCPIAYEQARNELVFPVEVLDHPLRMANELTSQLCEQQCKTILQNLTQEQGLVDEVRKLIINKPGQVPTPVDIASQLNISYRTLRRRLGDEGTSFKQIHNEVRMELASEYIQQTNMTTQQIAFLLGYSEASNFHRAFRAWYGKTPGEYRQVASVTS
jgi:AraC-like DNA-binding protein